MKAMLLDTICNVAENPEPLAPTDVDRPVPSDGEVLIKISACGVCHTELDEIEGRTPPPKLPVIPGHQVTGTVEKTGKRVSKLKAGDRVGVAWIFSACGSCSMCLKGDENLCPGFMATGRDADGGYAEYMTVPESYAFTLPDSVSDIEAAPLLCAGAIGYRSLRLADIENGQRLGLTGFGASAHLVLKMVRHELPDVDVFVFARSPGQREFAVELGAVWAGDTDEDAPERLDSIIDTTPAWKPVVKAMKNLAPGGRLVINAIRKEDADRDYLLNLNYEKHLWDEKEIKSVANVAGRDVSEFLGLAVRANIRPEVETYSLEEANRALYEMKTSKIRGAKVLKIS